MDQVSEEAISAALLEARQCREGLATAAEGLRAGFTRLRADYERHLGRMETQTNTKLQELLREQTERVKAAEAQVNDRKNKTDPNKLATALTNLKRASKACLEFEISPDLDRLRFLSEFGILRVGQSSKPNKDTAESSWTRLNRSSELNKDQWSVDDDHSETDDNELTTDSGYIHVSNYRENIKDTRKDLFDCDSDTVITEKQDRLPKVTGEKTDIDVKKSQNEQFITLEDGKIITFTSGNRNVRLLSNEWKLLSQFQLKKPKAVCCLKKNSFLIVDETPSHDKLWVMRVTGQDVEKVKTIRIKCHNRISEVTYKGSSLYVMCDGDHLHMMDI